VQPIPESNMYLEHSGHNQMSPLVPHCGAIGMLGLPLGTSKTRRAWTVQSLQPSGLPAWSWSLRSRYELIALQSLLLNRLLDGHVTINAGSEEWKGRFLLTNRPFANSWSRLLLTDEEFRI